jgi:hypothetical protein
MGTEKQKKILYIQISMEKFKLTDPQTLDLFVGICIKTANPSRIPAFS